MARIKITPIQYTYPKGYDDGKGIAQYENHAALYKAHLRHIKAIADAIAQEARDTKSKVQFNRLSRELGDLEEYRQGFMDGYNTALKGK